MEDPANKLNIDADLKIKGDIKDQIDTIQKGICKALLEEDKSIIGEYNVSATPAAPPETSR